MMRHDFILWQMALGGMGIIIVALIAHIRIKRRKRKELELQIDKLQKTIEDANHTIAVLNEEIEQRMNHFSSRLKVGRMLYDQIMKNGTTSLWKKQHYQLFNEYYERTHSKEVAKLRKGRTKVQLTPHNLFYLILKEVGKSDKEVRDIMGISPEALRTLRFRTKAEK